MSVKLANKAAFTLIEILITVLVLCITFLVAMPALSSFLLNKRLMANTDLLVNALNYARNFALNESMNVVVCPFSAPSSTSCGANWGAGWIVVTQPTTGTSVLLKSQQFSTSDPTLSSTSSSVVFDQQGVTTTQSNFKFCDSRGGTYAQSIEVLATGYVQSGATAGQAVWNNGALSCP